MNLPAHREIFFCMHRYFIIYKPYQVLSQFTSSEGKQTLKAFFNVPSDVYPVGRLDYDSEGLLLLTNDASLNHRLLNPSFAHEREYWVQVDGDIHEKAIQELQRGVSITVNGTKYRTRPCKATRFANTPVVPERNRNRRIHDVEAVRCVFHPGRSSRPHDHGPARQCDE